MKTYITTLIVALFTLAGAFAETQTLTLDPSKMNQQQFAYYKSLLDSQVQPVTPKEVSDWADAGKAMGGAFRECWGAISTDVEKFANSPAGTWTAVLVTWKVAGRDLIDCTKTVVRWVFSGAFMFAYTLVMIPIFWRNCVQKRILVSTKGEGKEAEKKYDLSQPIHEEWALMYGIIYLLGIGIAALVAFA